MNDHRYPFQRSWRWHLVRFFDLVVERFPRKAHSLGFPNLVRKILVVRLDQIGDLVCSLPVFPILRKRFPEAKIFVLTGSDGKDILDQNPFVDDVIQFHSNWFARRKYFNLLEWIKIVFLLRKKGFDLAYDLRGDLRNIILMTLAGARYRVGYGIGGGAGLLHEVGVYDMQRHQAELNVKLVAGEVVDKADLKPTIYLSEPEKLKSLRELKDRGVEKDSKLIAVHPEAGYPSKEWGGEKFVELVTKLLTEPRNRVLVFGISKARKLVEHFSNSQRVIDLVGVFTLREMIAALSHCHLFIGNDSGPSHIAQALGIPMVVVASGTNDYDKWGVWARGARVLKHAVSCSPCHLQNCNVEGHPCMSKISVGEVFEKAQELSQTLTVSLHPSPLPLGERGGRRR